MARYTIEIVGPKNENLRFAPLGENLRGCWDTSHVAHREKSEGLKALAQIPRIPGMYLSLEINSDGTGTGSRLDPLRDTPEGQKLWKQLEVILKRNKSEFGDMTNLVERVDVKLSHDDVKNWAWIMRQAMDSNLARVVPGSAELPPATEISKWPGKRRSDPHNTRREPDEKLDSYTDRVPVNGERELVGADRNINKT